MSQTIRFQQKEKGAMDEIKKEIRCDYCGCEVDIIVDGNRYICEVCKFLKVLFSNNKR